MSWWGIIDSEQPTNCKVFNHCRCSNRVFNLVSMQFLNSSSLILTEAIMSTPVSASAPKPSAALTPVSRGDYTNLRTPHRNSQEPITRTPTPFKDALAEMEKKGGPINYIVRNYLTFFSVSLDLISSRWLVSIRFSVKLDFTWTSYHDSLFKIHRFNSSITFVVFMFAVAHSDAVRGFERNYRQRFWSFSHCSAHTRPSQFTLLTSFVSSFLQDSLSISVSFWGGRGSVRLLSLVYFSKFSSF